ncbi:M20/M25/M40 family metallo-hydrolase [Mucilaginibacter sp. JRF]|uniref:M20/M25/M40 family metallo-hydrolase n=1 Tax=Mucilaginibacter sp. JRF TaxID=2780088 RepID=UPI00187E88BB|nr:M20/M25/M40 family metallo-hydrolase [Mucilaginibacter sp. JRF]MBE9583590.1 M20/M25/M40 family metallo-hydrolase [Mucilaginibacter sp. JRF]
MSTVAMAQNEPDTAVFNRIKTAELNSSQIPQIAHYLTDVSGPRLANSQGYKRAANWAVSTMKKWGLANAGLEEWGEFGKQWDIDDFSINMKVPYVAPLRAYPNPWSANTKGVQQGKVQVLSPQQYTDTTYIALHASEFKGKWLLVAGNAPKSDSKFKPVAGRLADTALANMKDTYMVKREEIEGFVKYIDIYKKLDKMIENSGALGVITAGRSNADGAVFVQAYGGYRVNDPEGIPQLSMAVEDGQRIKRLIASGHPVEVAINIKSVTSTADTKGYNVIAEIPGTDPKLKSEVVMLGGHLDSWQAATGATDNAAGCIVMMEAVRLLDSLGLKPKRTIRIALWDGEEQGLYGSYGYVKKHFMDAAKFKAKPEQAKISAYFNLDNGTGKIRGIFTQNNKDVAPIFTQWLKPFNSLCASTVTLSNTGSTDHISFDWAGIPAFQFIQDEIDYETRTHHSNLDDYDHLQIDDLKQAAIIVASFVYQTSIRTQMLPRKPLKKETFVFEGL